ncbi:RNA-binding cell elongation regulator Jag/EloR [Effusibacillus dendaii]|uniref:RNA-binding protein KhpB n=1 Tax=Effusibacillus dendaii TaxID=2743772 RepID=A0A7I8DF38_9BACL|nr:RNA-binding cell elongation regulator Jag/EloR [Effusibacillus dendaii]BCJ87476.1 DNA-binding protein [Effusibacillus dendaii]
MKRVVTTGKTVEEAIQVALDKLGVSEDQIDVRVLTKPSRGLFGLIGSREAEIEAVVKEAEQAIETADLKPEVFDPLPDDQIVDVSVAVERAEQFLNDLVRSMNLNAQITVRQDKDGFYLFEIEGGQLGILIGKRGQTLDAVQYLVNLVANKHSKSFLRIILDAEGYRQRRKETLERLADRLAKQVIRERKEIELEPMPAHERKVIHTYLQGYKQVGTRSVGEEPNRKVTIFPK